MIVLAGDWAPGKKTANTHCGEGTFLINLEGPILRPDHALRPASKAGPHLFSTNPPNDEMRCAFALANNHTMDYGPAGLEATRDLLAARGIPHAGAGRDRQEARRPVVFSDAGVRIGLLSCCEAQFGVARRNAAGVAEIGPWIHQAIRSLSAEADVVIVSVHLAVEDSCWPSPAVQELYRSFVDAGACLVHGHHSHVPQGYEEYGGGVIFYGLGNFMVNTDSWRGTPNALWSLGAEVDLAGGKPRWRFLTFEIREEEGGSLRVEPSTPEETKTHEEYLGVCNRPLTDPRLLEALWQETAVRAYYCYGADFLCFPEGQKRRNLGWRERLPHLITGLRNTLEAFTGSVVQRHPRPSRGRYLLWHLMLACESHRSAVATALGVLGGEIEDLRTDETRRMADAMLPWSTDK